MSAPVTPAGSANPVDRVVPSAHRRPGHVAGAPDRLAILGRLHAKHPGVEVRLRQADTGTLLDEVHDASHDLAVVAPVGRPPQGISLRMLARDPLLLACSPTHPLANRQQVDLAVLAGERFVDFPVAFGLRQLIDRQFAAARLERVTALGVNDVPALLELVAHGLGVAVVPQVVSGHPAAVRYMPLRPPSPAFEVAVATAGDRPTNQAARVLLGMLLPASTQPSPGWLRVRRGDGLTAAPFGGRLTCYVAHSAGP